MNYSKQKNAVCCLLTAVMILLSMPSSFAANESCNSDIVITLTDTAVVHYQTVILSIYIKNNVDTLNSFQFWIQSSVPPEIFTFNTDSGLVFDTTGSILAGWEYLEKISVSGTGSDIRLTGFADLPGPIVTSGSPPDSAKQLLGRLYGKHPASVFDTLNEHTVDLIVNTSFTDFIQLETSDPNFTIWEYNEVLDTNGFVCIQWNVDTTQNPPDTIGCLGWQQTATPPWDSTEIVVDSVRFLDSSRLCFEDSRVRLYLCGDVNGDGNPLNILDLNRLVNRIFRSGPPGNPPLAADMNCDSAVNILDLNVIVNYIFRFGPAPCTNPSCFE